MTFKIPILSNTLFDLNKFDFSFLGLNIYDISSSNFKKFIKNLNPEFYGGNISFFDDIIIKITFEKDRKYAIVKDDYNVDYNENDLYDVFKILKIIMPSELEIAYIVNFEEKNNFIQSTYMSTHQKKYCPKENYLMCEKNKIKKINEFIKQVFKNQKTNTNIELSIENYMNSYNASHIHFSFIALCISLESLINGRVELNYRLKRLIAIICGQDVEKSNIIYTNIGLIYDLRSEIVHGVKYSEKKIHLYYNYLQSIVSVTLIELLIHNIKNTDDLNFKVTTLGFGQRKLISTNWKKFEINSTTISNVNKIKLDK